MTTITRVSAGAGLVLACALAGWAQDDAGWQEFKGTHFIVSYRGNKALAEQTMKAAESHYDRIAKDLGYVRYDRFWLWENRVRILIYEDRDAFVRATGAPTWAYAKADYRKREISGIATEPIFVSKHLPHEIAHLVFRDFVGFSGKIPQWLDEGFAMREESGGRSEAGAMVADLGRRGQLIAIGSLTAMDVTGVADPYLARRFYLQSVTLVGYLIELKGGESFQKFCRGLRDGKSIDESLRLAYGKTVPDIGALETGWLRSLAETGGNR